MVKRILRPINLQNYNRSIHEIVLEKLQEAIVSGLLKPGEKLMEAELAEELCVSRTPVREAIRKLEMEGFVRAIPRKGVYVIDYSEKDIIDNLEVRLALELLAVELAVENITDTEIGELEKTLEEEAVSIESDDRQAIVNKDTQFHDIIYRAGKSQKLIQIMGNLREQINRYRFVSLGGQGRGKEVLVEHGRIFEALKLRDAELVKERTWEHIKNTQDALIAAIKEKQQKGTA